MRLWLQDMTTLKNARRYEELLGDNVADSPYEYAMLFEAKGWFAKQRAKARFKLMQRIDAKLSRVLRPGERVYFVTKGSLASTAEQFFAGQAVAYYINLRALVFTTERVIFMQIGSDLKPRELVSELAYTSILKVKATWSGMCEVQLANKKKHRFSGMPKADRQFLGKFLSGVVTQPAGAAVPDKKSDGLAHLCPHCFTHVPDWPLACGGCGGGIKSARTAALLSLAFPGLGDWYLGHRFFAVAEMIGTAFLWLVLVIGPLLGTETPEDAKQLSGGYWLFAAVFVGGAHLIDSAVTHSFARKGHHPAKAVPVVARA